MHQKVCRVGLCPRSLAALAALLLQLGCVARARAASPRFDSFIPGSGIAVLSVLCTLHARCGTRAACTCFSAAPHAHQAASAFAGPPAAPTARHGPPNSVITVCYRSQPSVLEMYVVKRSGKKEPVHFDKITARIAKLCTDAAVWVRKRVCNSHRRACARA